MPGMRCAVAICNNSYFKTKSRPDGVSYFRFPKDERIKKLWVERCKRKDSFNPGTSYICSDHFNSHDFVRDFRGELMKLATKKKTINKDAIPSLNLLPNEKTEKVTPRGERKEQRERKEMVSSLLKYSSALENDENGEMENVLGTVNGTNVEFNAANSDVNEVTDYKSEYMKMKESFELYKKEQEQKIKTLGNECSSLKKDIAVTVSKEVHNVLSGVFSKAQIDLILNKKKKVKTWSSEDITKAFTIRYLSKRCYIHIRTKMGIPLPSLSTLKEWASKLHIHRGVLDGVLNLMQVAAVKMTTFEKFTVIQYDEMKVMSVHEYDSVNDQAVGPYDQAQVIMVRSLCGSWKQPIFTEFDTKMTRACLNEIIEKLYAIGFTVVAVVSDCGGGNVGVWNEYNISYRNSSFPSDVTNRNVYFFADVPHLLKLIRNWYIDGGFVMPDGSKISPEPVKMLVDKTHNLEISSCHKLTSKHVHCETFQRQNVLLAAQLMSNTTSCALRRYEICDETLRISSAKFIKSTNDWFDVMNSRCPNASLPLQCGYGLHIKEQKQVLDDYIEIIEQIRCIEKKGAVQKKQNGPLKNVEETNKNPPNIKNKKKALKLFQKGVIMTTKSLMSLFADLKTDFNLSYILTSKLNQDSLENLFSLVRGSGGCNDHPTPMEFLSRMRLIILGKNDNFRKNCNTHQTDDEFVVGKVLEATKVRTENSTDFSVLEKETEVDSETEEGFELISENNLVDTSIKQVEGSSSIKEQVTSDGLCYISGWIAKKLKSKYPHLGSYTFQRNRVEESWVSELSVGGLTEPSSEFERTMSKMEQAFNRFIGEGLPKTVGLKRKLIKTLKEEVKEVDDEIVNLFARRRIIMRVKYLNKQRLILKNSHKLKKLYKITT